MAANFWNYNSGGLFGSTSNNSGSGLNSLYGVLSDRSAIKNGSYQRLLKTYYRSGQSSSTASSSKNSSSSSNMLDRIFEEKRNPKVSKDVQEANANLTSGLSTLRTTVSTLQKDDTYTDTADGKSAGDKVVSAVKAYVTDYNNVVNAAKGSTLTNKTAYVANMMGSTAANADKLAEIGITVDSSGTLELDETKLKSASISKVQELFSAKDITSYGSTIASRLRFAGAAVSSNTTTGSTGTDNKAGTSAAGLKTDSKALASDELYAKVKDKDGNETYDVNKIFTTAKSFVSNYNHMFDTGESSSNSGVLANLSYIREKTARNADALKQFGIEVNDQGRLKIDEHVFKQSDMSKVQAFFKDYGSSIATNASLVDYYTTTQANATNGYTSDGTYNVQGSSRYADTM
ncbi:flagellar filament capping protein FliD [Parablautia muri]|uniref:flagellar filament capping protein FliD n=1 Tax=Parablautia muri TaxID=2320879 RepID=UPI002ED0463E